MLAFPPAHKQHRQAASQYSTATTAVTCSAPSRTIPSPRLCAPSGNQRGAVRNFCTRSRAVNAGSTEMNHIDTRGVPRAEGSEQRLPSFSEWSPVSSYGVECGGIASEVNDGSCRSRDLHLWARYGTGGSAPRVGSGEAAAPSWTSLAGNGPDLDLASRREALSELPSRRQSGSLQQRAPAEPDIFRCPRKTNTQ